MTKSSIILALAALLVAPSAAFVPSPRAVPPASAALSATDAEGESSVFSGVSAVSRRAFGLATATATLSLALPASGAEEAASAPTVVVAGATGQTGR